MTSVRTSGCAPGRVEWLGNHTDYNDGLVLDLCWVLNRQSSGDNIALAARLSDPVSGRVLEISTNRPGIQFCDGKYLDGSAIGRSGVACGPRAGLCLEPQNFPDAPNHTNFPTSHLDPYQIYSNGVLYKLAANRSGIASKQMGARGNNSPCQPSKRAALSLSEPR